jgi:hypothetical protein
MRRRTVIDLDDRVLLDAAELSVATKLALAHSIMLATARHTVPCSGPRMPTSKGTRGYD